MVTVCVNVMLTPWVGVGITSPVRKMEGNFLSKRFTLLGTESGIFCVDGMESNSSTIGETLGKGSSVESKQYLAGLWSNSDSELSQEINAKNGTCHCGLQNFSCKKLALKLGGFGNETPREDWLTICTLKQGARWPSIECAGNNTQFCPNVHQVPIVCQLVR